MNQASFFCPHCNQQRLFQSTPMNHVPHILAAVFLCGIWLPIWIIIALSHEDIWRCSFCGYSNAVKYLQNPRLREQEQVAAQQQQIVNQQRAEERQRLLLEMPRDTGSEKMSYYWAAHKIPILLVGGGVLFISFLVLSSVVSSPRAKTAPAVEPSKRTDVKPIFNAAALVGKSSKEVANILGSPTESWTSRSNTLMQTYALGEEMTVEFSGNSIDSLVIFFSQKNVDTDTAYRFVGLDNSKPKPAGISNVTTGADWIKVFYAKMASTSPSAAPINPTMRPSLTPIQSRKATIISENANLRSTTDTYGEVLLVVPFGEEVEVIKQKGPWFQVKYLSQSGWIHGNTIRLSQ